MTVSSEIDIVRLDNVEEDAREEQMTALAPSCPAGRPTRPGHYSSPSSEVGDQEPILRDALGDGLTVAQHSALLTHRHAVRDAPVVGCDRTIRQGKTLKARQGADLATVVHNLADVAVMSPTPTSPCACTLASLPLTSSAEPGSAVAQGEGHQGVADLLKAAAPGFELHLAAMLGMKTKSATATCLLPPARSSVSPGGRGTPR